MSSWSISSSWFRFRNRLLSSKRFQRWAARFPLTRFVARRRAASLFDLCAGFVYSQVLLAAVQLGLFDVMIGEPQTASAIASKIGLDIAATRRLLDAGAALRLVERRGSERYGLGVHGASLAANPEVAAMVAHNAILYRDLADPVALLRGERATELARFWSYSRDEASASAGPYSALMAGTISLLAEDILEAYPFEDHRCLVDVAGGEGAFLEAVADRAPGLDLTLFELPPVARRARARFARSGLDARVAVVEGDVLADPVPSGADLATLVRVIHDHDDDVALTILRAVRRSLRRDGVVLVAEPMAGTPGAEPMGDAYFGFYLLAMGHGRPRSYAELEGLLGAAGFHRIESVPTRRPMLTSILTGRAV